MWTVLLISALTTGQPAFDLETLGGEVISGRVAAIDSERITVATTDGPVSLEVDQLARLHASGHPDELAGGHAVSVELVDGSSLVGFDYTAGYGQRPQVSLGGGQARITLRGGEVISLPLGDVAAVRLQLPSESVNAEWLRLLESEADGDLLVIRKDDSIDYHHGVLREVSGTTVYFELEGDVLPVKRAKVFGLIYHRSHQPELAPAVCRVTELDGSQWVVRSIASAGENISFTTPVGLEVVRPLSTIGRIDFSQGKIVYLSDLKPDSVDWTPYFGDGKHPATLPEFFAPREDHNLRAGPLELGGKQYRKGLAVQSRTSLVYRLPGHFRRFRATLGIDDRLRPYGNALVVIRGDDAVLLEMSVSGTDPPRAVDLDVRGVRRIGILVDFGEDLDVGDHVDLCEARIVK